MSLYFHLNNQLKEFNVKNLDIKAQIWLTMTKHDYCRLSYSNQYTLKPFLRIGA